MKKVFNSSFDAQKSAPAQHLANLPSPNTLSLFELQEIQMEDLTDKFGSRALAFLDTLRGIEAHCSTKDDSRREILEQILKSRDDCHSSALSKHRRENQKLLPFAILPNGLLWIGYWKN